MTTTAKAHKRNRRTEHSPHSKVHPVIIYPFKPSSDYADLKALYEFVGELNRHRELYAQPLTVIDRKTHLALEHDEVYQSFRQTTVAKCSQILDAWCVDTCQMWYAGLGHAFEQGTPNDVYWVIPGDFNYGSPRGREVLSHLHDLPEIVLELDQDVCIGEIATDHNNSKQIIDTYGTFALLYTWFPREAQEIRALTERPRSEFFALRHGFLREVLSERWYPYEQTMVMLLHAILMKKQVSRFFVGNITDLPEGKEPLDAAIQQVERTERVLKTVWRARHRSHSDWLSRYLVLEAQSEQVRRTALGVLNNLLS